jgi:hypothetical protein
VKWMIISIVSVVTTSRAVILGLVSPSVVSVVGSFCVVSGRGALLFIADSSDVLVLVIVEVVGASIYLIGALCFPVCRYATVMFGALLKGVLMSLGFLCPYRPVLYRIAPFLSSTLSAHFR